LEDALGDLVAAIVAYDLGLVTAWPAPRRSHNRLVEIDDPTMPWPRLAIARLMHTPPGPAGDRVLQTLDGQPIRGALTCWEVPRMRWSHVAGIARAHPDAALRGHDVLRPWACVWLWRRDS